MSRLVQETSQGDASDRRGRRVNVIRTMNLAPVATLGRVMPSWRTHGFVVTPPGFRLHKGAAR